MVGSDRNASLIVSVWAGYASFDASINLGSSRSRLGIGKRKNRRVEKGLVSERESKNRTAVEPRASV